MYPVIACASTLPIVTAWLPVLHRAGARVYIRAGVFSSCTLPPLHQALGCGVPGIPAAPGVLCLSAGVRRGAPADPIIGEAKHVNKQMKKSWREGRSLGMGGGRRGGGGGRRRERRGGCSVFFSFVLWLFYFYFFFYCKFFFVLYDVFYCLFFTFH